MGFFSSIKNNLTGGGIDIIVDAPPLFTETILVRVKLTAKSLQTVNSIVVRLEKLEFSSDQETTPSHREVLAESQLADAFEAQAGQSQVIEGTLNVSMSSQLQNAAAGQGESAPQAIEALTGAVDKFSNVFGALSSKRIEYKVVATADVEGVSFDPSSSIDVKIQQPGELSASTRTPRF